MLVPSRGTPTRAALARDGGRSLYGLVCHGSSTMSKTLTFDDVSRSVETLATIALYLGLRSRLLCFTQANSYLGPAM